MGKLKTCERSGTCSHKARNLIVVSAIIGALLTGLAVTSLSESPIPTGFTIGNECWNISSGLYGAKVNSYQYLIPSSVPSILPTQVVDSPTGTVLRLDCDRQSTDNVPYAYYSGWGHSGAKDGQCPDVVFEVSRTWPTISDNGVETPDHKPQIYWEEDQPLNDGSIKHLYQYWFASSVVMKTLSTYTDEAIWAGWNNNDEMTPREFDPVDCILWLKIHLDTQFTNESFTWYYGGGKVLSVDQQWEATESDLHTLEENYMGAGQQPDFQWSIQNVLDKNPSLSPLYGMGSSSGQGTGDIVLQVSGRLQPGEVFTRGGWIERTGLLGYVDCFLEYTVVYSIVVSAPLSIGGGTSEQKIDIVRYLQDIITHPDNPMFWVIIMVVVLVLVMLIPKKKPGMAIYQHFHSGERKPEPGF
jgi:hypothetical protein